LRDQKLKSTQLQAVQDLLKSDSKIFHDLDYFLQNKQKVNNVNISNAVQIGLEDEFVLKNNLKFCQKQLQSLN